MSKKEVLIIIPAYNEEENIEKVLKGLETPEIQAFADILVMNDHSTDKTNFLVKRHRRVTMATHIYNLGYGGGIRLGYKYAVRRGYSYVIQMDADGQHDVCNVPVLYRELLTPDQDGNLPDIVLGARFMEGSAPFPVSPVKKFAYSFFTLMIRLGTGKVIHDSTTGLQGLSRRAMLFYSQFGNFDDRYPDANMITQMLLLGFHVREVPAVMHARTAGVSMHSGFKPVVYMIRNSLSILAVVFRIRVLKWNQGAAEKYAEIMQE
ncbi:MAG: glycosyltransferase family 2 protein [Lachnospiraceae bacterium]|nr:glycosyltransferase family 2 protein [Lachnospiraceae bacterium]